MHFMLETIAAGLMMGTGPAGPPAMQAAAALTRDCSKAI